MFADLPVAAPKWTLHQVWEGSGADFAENADLLQFGMKVATGVPAEGALSETVGGLSRDGLSARIVR